MDPRRRSCQTNWVSDIEELEGKAEQITGTDCRSGLLDTHSNDILSWQTCYTMLDAAWSFNYLLLLSIVSFQVQAKERKVER